MRVAVLSHGTVLRDARIIKEARTLSGAGYLIEIHGLIDSFTAEEHTLPGTNIKVFLNPKPKPQPLFRYMRPSSGIVAAIEAATLLIANIYLIWLVDNAIALSLVVSAQIAFATFACYWRAKIKKFASNLRYLGRRITTSGARLIRSIARRLSRARLFGKSVYRKRFESMAARLQASLDIRPKPDIVHIHDHVALLAASSIKRKYHIPIVWDAHEIYEDLAASDRERAQLNREIIEENQHYIDKFITINDSIARFYRKEYSNLSGATIIMNATLPLALPKYDGRLHRAAGLPPEQRILLFQGGFAPRRGLQHLVRAAHALLPDWSLVLMGWGNLETELRSLAAEYSRPNAPSEAIFLPGVPQDELLSWSAGATVGAIPYENTSRNHLYCTPNKLWEYPAAGVPILCTDLVEMAAFVERHRTGFLLPRDFSAADIANVVNSLTASQIEEARSNCASFISTNNWRHYEPRLIDVYEGLRNRQSVSKA